MMYELTILLAEETELPEVKKLIEAHKGIIKKEENTGKKTLSYAIKKQRSAHFFQLDIDMPENMTTDFRKKLNFNDKLLRYLLLLKD